MLIQFNWVQNLKQLFKGSSTKDNIVNSAVLFSSDSASADKSIIAFNNYKKLS